MENLDSLNQKYFETLYDLFKNPKKHSLKICVGNEGNVFPTAIASDEIMLNLPHIQYEDLLKNKKDLEQSAKDVCLWIKKMQAGTGTSLERTEYLKKVRDSDAVNIGAKGTDLYIEINDKLMSLAQVQIMQMKKFADDKKVGEVYFHDIVGPETQNSLQKIWDDENINSLCNDNFFYFGKSFQDHIPNLNEDLQITDERKSPGGHGLFAFEAILNCLDENKLPKTDKTLISSIGNGEDLGSRPDELILGHMRLNEIPIIMVTTTKTENDLKGGQIAIAKENNFYYATIIEKAQAQENDQLELFEQLGLREKDSMAFFNTNMALINYDILVPLIQKLYNEIGEKEFYKVISPDLIQNWKKKGNKEFLQLEGAMGSILLNLDKYFRKKYKKELITFVNIDQKNRSRFFSPIKTAFDFWMQFYSDRFSFDKEHFELINNFPEGLPKIELDKEYKSLNIVLNRFNNTSIGQLRHLRVNGSVDFSSCKLAGNIIVNNLSERIYRPDKNLKDIEIQIDATGSVSSKDISSIRI